MSLAASLWIVARVEKGTEETVEGGNKAKGGHRRENEENGGKTGKKDDRRVTREKGVEKREKERGSSAIKRTQRGRVQPVCASSNAPLAR